MACWGGKRTSWCWTDWRRREQEEQGGWAECCEVGSAACLHRYVTAHLYAAQGLFSSFSTHEIFPSLFSFYFKIWVFVFESVTFCLFRVSFALREIHTGALGIGYLLHSFLHSGKWTSAATRSLAEAMWRSKMSPSFILPLSLPSFPLCHSFRNLNVTSLRASISTSRIRRNNQRNLADVVFRLKTFPGCADWGFLSVQLLRDKAEEQLLRIQKPEIKHVCRSFRAECADSALLLLECLHFFWFLLLLLLRFDSLWRLFALSLQRQFVQTDRQTDRLSVGRLSAAPGFCVKVWSELQTDTTTPPPPSRHLIPEQLPSSLSPLPVVWFSFSLFSEAEIWSKRKTLEKNSSRIFKIVPLYQHQSLTSTYSPPLMTLLFLFLTAAQIQVSGWCEQQLATTRGLQPFIPHVPAALGASVWDRNKGHISVVLRSVHRREQTPNMSKHFLQAEQRSAATCWDMLTYLNILLIILLDQLSAAYAALASFLMLRLKASVLAPVTWKDWIWSFWTLNWELEALSAFYPSCTHMGSIISVVHVESNHWPSPWKLPEEGGSPYDVHSL